MIASRSTVRGRPERGSSTRPSIPACTYLLRYNVTVGRDTPTRAAISVFDTPSAASSTILARCANPARIDVDRTHDDNTCRSPSRTTNRATRTRRSHSPRTENYPSTRGTMSCADNRYCVDVTATT